MLKPQPYPIALFDYSITLVLFPTKLKTSLQLPYSYISSTSTLARAIAPMRVCVCIDTYACTCMCVYIQSIDMRSLTWLPRNIQYMHKTLRNQGHSRGEGAGDICPPPPLFLENLAECSSLKINCCQKDTSWIS